MANPFHHKRQRENSKSAQKLARQYLADMTERMVIATLVAGGRSGAIPAEAAAAKLQMTPEAFAAAGQIVDQEARRILEQP